MAGMQSGFVFATNKFVVAGFKQQAGSLAIRPTTPNNERPEVKLFGAKHGFRGPPPKLVKRHVAQFEGSTNNEFGASWYSNVLRRQDNVAAESADDEDPATKAINRLFSYLQKSKLDVVANFARMDADGSGELDEEEFKAALLGEQLRARKRAPASAFPIVPPVADRPACVRQTWGWRCPTTRCSW